jgi:ABC-2 type transport system permease protein
VSAWAKRAAFLWAAAPLAVIGILDRIIFHTSHFGGLLNYLFFGGCMHAFDFGMKDDVTLVPLAMLTPWKFLSTPGLWLALGLAVALLYAAARLRRNREPL